MKRAVVVVVLLVAAIATWLALRGDAPSNEATPADNGDAEHLSRGRRELGSDDGTFVIRNLRPGAAHVEIRLGINDEHPMLSIDDVPVVAGQITRDPRLIDVEPLKLTSAVHVDAVAKDGSTLNARLHFRRSGGRGPWSRSWTSVIRADPKAVADGLDVLVTCDGFRSTVARDVRADTKVVLERLRPSVVRVRLKEGAPMPSPPWQLSAELYWIEPGRSDDDGVGDDPRNPRHAVFASFAKDRVMTFDGVEPGRYRVVLFLGERDMNSSYGGSIDSDPKVIVATVADDGAPVEVVVGVDPREMSRETKRAR